MKKKPLQALACAIALSIPLAAGAQQSSPSAQKAAPAAKKTAPAAQKAAPDAPPANASEIDPAKLAKLRERARTDRKGLVAKNLPLTDEEAKAFWPVYDKCRKSLDASHSKVNRAMTDYASAGDKMTDENAKRILSDVLSGEAQEAKARSNCFRDVAKVLPGKKAARYFQIETKILSLFRFDAAVAIPLVE
jgi:hypothetical protein